MANYTPRGLKIRLALDHAFALINRLRPEVDAFKVLKTTEGIEDLTSLVTFSTGLVCFLMKLDPLYIAISVFVAYLLAILINLKGFYVIPGLVGLGTLYSYISGYGILLAGLSVAGYFLVGWQGVVAFFIGRFLAWSISQVLEIQDMKRIYKMTGLPLTASERHFFNAYRIHASRLGKTTDISVTEEELSEDNWKPAFNELAIKWPEVVARFTLD